MTIAAVLRKAGNLPPLEAELLLAHAFGKSREWILAHPDDEVDHNSAIIFADAVSRREKHEPLAYITGTKEFYGRNFRVTPETLIPRPSTETLIGSALDYLQQPHDQDRIADTDITIFSRMIKTVTPQCIVDVGTGSGCIAITLALETKLPLIATDISPAALDVARQNAIAHGVLQQIDFEAGADLIPVRQLSHFFLLVSNPPYVPDGEALAPDVTDYEPESALFGGKDGSDIVARLTRAARQHPYCCGMIIEAKDSHAPCFARQ